jgi:tape measure domain-containing protein
MAYDGSLKFDTRVDSSGFKSGIEKLGSIAKTGLKVTATAIGAVSGAFGAAVLSGVKYNSQMEQYITSFGTMLGSAEEATKLVNNLKEMGAKTPFETSDLAKASQTLLAFGTSAEDLLPTLQMLGDVSQGNKERFDSLTLAFAQVGSAGKLSGQDLLQFVNAGFNPLNEISKMTGESMAELKERMSAGGVSAEEVAEAFKHATSEGGQFYQAMEAQSQTFNGQMSTLKDNAMSFIGELTQGVTNTLKDSVLPTVNGWLEELQSAFTSNGVEGVVTAFGSILADACTKLAQAAPGVVDLAVGFIQSFIKGIGDNAPQLIQAAKQIVGALVDGLIKLLPSEIQKPVKETVNILKRSFESGGLRNAINTVSKILKDLGKVVTNLAKTILPPLAKAVDFLGKNIKIILPLIAEAVVGIKAFKIVQSATKWFDAMKTAIAAAGAATSAEALATAASTGAITLKQIAVGVLTGEIGLVTAAQWLWNAAMSANPIGAIIALVTALAGGLAFLCVSLSNSADDTDILAESNERVAESFGHIADGIEQWNEKVDNAKSSMEGFNDSILMSQEEQQNLTDEMDAVQTEISEIARLASEERRELTDSEVQRLDELFQKMRDLSKQELEFYQGRQDVVLDQAKALSEASNLTAEEYEDMSARIIKAASEETEAVKEKAYEQYSNQVALNKSLLGQKEEYTEEWLEQANAAALADYQIAVDNAEQKYADILGIEAEGYSQRSEFYQDFVDRNKELKGQIEEEEQRHNNRIKELNDEILAIEKDESLSYDQMTYFRSLKQDEIEQATEDHNARLAEIERSYLEGFDEATLKQAGGWLQRIIDTKAAGEDLTEEQEELARNLILALDSLPDDMNEKGKKALDALGIGLDDQGNVIFTKGERLGEIVLEGEESADPEGENSYSNGKNSADGFVGGVESGFQAAFTAGYNIAKQAMAGQQTAQDSHSPAKETIKLGKDNAEGYALGIEKNAKEAAAAAKDMVTDTIGAISDQSGKYSFLDKFGLSKLDVSGMVQKMKAAVATESYRMSASLSASGNYAALRDSSYNSGTDSAAPQGKYVAEIHVDLEGREVARATAPFMGEQLAWEG